MWKFWTLLKTSTKTHALQQGKNSSFCCSSVNLHFLDGANIRIHWTRNWSRSGPIWHKDLTWHNHLRIFSVYILQLLKCGSGKGQGGMKELQVWNRTLGTWKRLKEDFHPSFFWICQCLFRLPIFHGLQSAMHLKTCKVGNDTFMCLQKKGTQTPCKN